MKALSSIKTFVSWRCINITRTRYSATFHRPCLSRIWHLKRYVKMHRNVKTHYFHFTPWFNYLTQEVYKATQHKQYWHSNSGTKGTSVMGVTVTGTRSIVNSSRDCSNHRSMAYTIFVSPWPNRLESRGAQNMLQHDGCSERNEHFTR